MARALSDGHPTLDYKEKYLRYKRKYLELRFKIKGF